MRNGDDRAGKVLQIVLQNRESFYVEVVCRFIQKQNIRRRHEYCQKIILDYIRKFGEGKKSDFEDILLAKLPDVLDEQQKYNKIKNNLQSLRKQGLIYPEGKNWKMSKT